VKILHERKMCIIEQPLNIHQSVSDLAEIFSWWGRTKLGLWR